MPKQKAVPTFFLLICKTMPHAQGFLVILPRDLLKLQLQGQLSVTIEVNSPGETALQSPQQLADHAITAQTSLNN